MTQTIEETNKKLVLEAFDTLFNKRDYQEAERFWSPNYIQHSAHIKATKRAAASVVALFCVATAVFFHANLADPTQTFHFIKNWVMTGGLLQIAAFGAGAFSVDNGRQ